MPNYEAFTQSSHETAPMAAAKALLANSVRHLIRRDQFDPDNAATWDALHDLGVALAALPIASVDYSMVKNRLDAIHRYGQISEYGAMRWELDLLLHWLKSMGWTSQSLVTQPGR